MRSTPIAALLLLLLAGLLAACGGAQVSQDYDPGMDFSRLRTFDWYPSQEPVSNDPATNSPLIAQRIRSAVVRNLTQKGYQKVEDRTPDFFVHYQLSVRQKLSSSGVSTSVGIGGGFGGGGFGGIGIGGPSVREIEEGTLVLDVIEAGSGKLAWRGTGSKPLSKSPTPEKTTQEVDATVDQILAQFPPETGK